MTPTKQFQNEVARKLTNLFTSYIIEIQQSTGWNNCNAIMGETQLIRSQYNTIDELLDVNEIDLPYDDDAGRLFICHKLLQLEVDKIREDKGLRNAPTFRVLECVSESISRYFENDAAQICPGHLNGQPIYSPIVDLAIVPTIKYRGRTQPIGIYPLYNGRNIFGLLDSLSFVQLLNRNMTDICLENYNRIGLRYENVEHNYRPLCLFALEIENQINKKHLMGDFMNSLLLARHPIVLVPENKLDDCLELVKLSRIISDIKHVNIYDLLRRVMVLSIPQFRQSVDLLLHERGISCLEIQEFR